MPTLNEAELAESVSRYTTGPRRPPTSAAAMLMAVPHSIATLVHSDLNPEETQALFASAMLFERAAGAVAASICASQAFAMEAPEFREGDLGMRLGALAQGLGAVAVAEMAPARAAHLERLGPLNALTWLKSLSATATDAAFRRLLQQPGVLESQLHSAGLDRGLARAVREPFFSRTGHARTVDDCSDVVVKLMASAAARHSPQITEFPEQHLADLQDRDGFGMGAYRVQEAISLQVLMAIHRHIPSAILASGEGSLPRELVRALLSRPDAVQVLPVAKLETLSEIRRQQFVLQALLAAASLTGTAYSPTHPRRGEGYVQGLLLAALGEHEALRFEPSDQVKATLAGPVQALDLAALRALHSMDEWDRILTAASFPQREVAVLLDPDLAEDPTIVPRLMQIVDQSLVSKAARLGMPPTTMHQLSRMGNEAQTDYRVSLHHKATQLRVAEERVLREISVAAAAPGARPEVEEDMGFTG